MSRLTRAKSISCFVVPHVLAFAEAMTVISRAAPLPTATHYAEPKRNRKAQWKQERHPMGKRGH